MNTLDEGVSQSKRRKTELKSNKDNEKLFHYS